MTSALFGIRAKVTELGSERDQNFLLVADDGRRRVLKVANRKEVRAFLEAENAVMRSVASTGLCPVPVPTIDGPEIASSGEHLVRVITHLPGRTLATVGLRTPELLRSLGRAVAQIDGALLDVDHSAARRDLHWDLARAPANIASRSMLVVDDGLRRVVESVLSRHDHHVPTIAALRRSVIHNDANDHNVLVEVSLSGLDDRITGIVDFGDMVWTHTVNGLAIAMAYAALGQPDPLCAAAEVVRGYHEVLALDDDEVSVLFHLMCLRLCTSVCIAAEQTAARPQDPYLAISQGSIASTLPTLAAIHPRLAHYVLRDSCGWSPVPHAAAVVEWLRARQGTFAPVVGRDLATTPVIGLDLGVGSPLVAGDPALNATPLLTSRLFERMAEAGVEIGVGGYDEARVIYGPVVRLEPPDAPEQRTIHLAIDITMVAGTSIHAPLAGVVHGFEDADAHHDYGPVIVLRHEVPRDDSPIRKPLPFYTLYGHLDRASLVGLRVGQEIGAGERFASIGEAPSNGDWWPHTHVQLITDMLDVGCNFNGVAPASQRSVWTSICPDPNVFLGIPPEVVRSQPARSAIAAARQARIGRNVGVSYGSSPLNILRGWKQHLFDETGRAYLDGYNNVAHVGHSHPRVVRAVSEQMAVLNTNTRYLQRQLTDYAELLTSLLPSPLAVCYFTASGSEANELALRLARAHTGRRDLVVMDGSYHGHTTSLIDISPYKHAGPGGEGPPEWVHTSVIPDVYRTAVDPDGAGQMFAARVGEVIADLVGLGRPPGAYIAETCPSVAGQLILPDGFLAEVYRIVRAAGGLCIADEVQTGFGRIGSHFWSFQQHDVVPDIVVLGKPIANGYPMGAVITTPEIAASFDNGMEFFSTFGGSTAACAAAHATLSVVIDEGLQEHALILGEHLLQGLRQLQATHDLIGDVRGRGLFLGVELVSDRATREPAPEEADWVVRRMRALGVLIGTDGPHHNVLKLRGPMCLTELDANVILRVLDQSLADATDLRCR